MSVQTYLRLSISLVMVFITACVPVRAIRTQIPGTPAAGSAAILATPKLAEACITGGKHDGEQLSAIEDYGSYVIGYAEFDDQGWSYSGESQLKAIQARLQSDLQNPAYSDMDFSIIVFVHGWHHNAHDNDCNVQEMRQMISLSNAQFKTAFDAGKLKRQRRLFGIYAGWRGESVDAALLRYATVIDRRNAAEKVAKGSIRQLLANLHEQERSARLSSGRDRKKDQVDWADRMFTTVVGHSFGGLIVFNGLSQYLIDDLTIACSGEVTAITGEQPSVWPDEVILINPAFEASRFETLNRLAEQSVNCRGLSKLPLMTVITADNDQWTGGNFTAARRMLTLFEPYDESTPEAREREKDANIHAIGFVNRYKTHRLCLQSYKKPDSTDASRAVVYAIKPEESSDVGVTRQVWVTGAPKSIVDGHNGFLFAPSPSGPQPYLLDWLVAMHIPGSGVVVSESECEPLK
jgi:hypothetical protein